MIDSVPIRKQNHFDVRERALLFLVVLCELSSPSSKVLHRLEHSEQRTPQQAQHVCCCQYGDE